MNSFLQLLAEDLIRKYQYNLKDLTVLFPNKRAGLFLAEALSKRIGQPIWMPAILTYPVLRRNLKISTSGETCF